MRRRDLQYAPHVDMRNALTPARRRPAPLVALAFVPVSCAFPALVLLGTAHNSSVGSAKPLNDDF